MSVVGAIRFDGKVADFLTRARNVMDDRAITHIADQIERMRAAGVPAADIDAVREHVLANWAEDRDRCLAEMRHHLADIPPGELIEFEVRE
jgi:hypothetical protein